MYANFDGQSSCGSFWGSEVRVMSVGNTKRRYGVGTRKGKSTDEARPATIENMAEVFGSVEVAEEMKEMSDAMDQIVEGVTAKLRADREAGLRSPDPDDSMEDDEDQLRPGWDT